MEQSRNPNIRPIGGSKEAAPLQQSEGHRKALRQQLAACKFYLDGVDAHIEKQIRNRFQLLGLSVVPFFSKNCTHVVTTTPFNDKKLEEKQPTSNPIIDNAVKWNIKVWSLDKLQRHLQMMMEGNGSGNRAAARGKIDKLMAMEKVYGVGTSHGERHHPVFIPFTEYYLSVEDATQMHRPVTQKQWKRNEVAWPFLKKTPAPKSPFARIPSRPPPPSAEQKAGTDKQGDVQLPLTKQLAVKDSNANPASPVPSDMLKPSGIRPTSTTMRTNTTTTTTANTTSRLTSKAYNDKRPAHDDNVAKLDRRMVDNNTVRTAAVTKAANNAAQKMIDADAIRAKNNMKKKMEQELNYCEICNKRFSHLNEHIQEKGHLAFIKDQNNFKQLDALLATVRRQYKKPLPSHMKPDIDINIDGDNVEFELDAAGTKRSIDYMDVDEEESPLAKRSATATATAASYPPISQ
ncbi:hypothetical protein K492DRAFT_239910 [Lichtheimia hyalospora FSU 10163]|nr:hypothetical protein K492DRAFT_239910 [Lichtheimia hyalospora FSU 10163]